MIIINSNYLKFLFFVKSYKGNEIIDIDIYLN